MLVICFNLNYADIKNKIFVPPPPNFCKIRYIKTANKSVLLKCKIKKRNKE